MEVNSQFQRLTNPIISHLQTEKLEMAASCVWAQQPLSPWPSLVTNILPTTGFSPTTLGSKDHTEGRAPRLPPQGGCRAPQAVGGLLQGALWHHAYLRWASHIGFSCPTSCPISLSSQGRLQLWERAAAWSLTVLNCPQDGGLPGAPAAPRRSWRPGFGCLARVPVLLGLLSWGPPHHADCYGDSPCPRKMKKKYLFRGIEDFR